MPDRERVILVVNLALLALGLSLVLSLPAITLRLPGLNLAVVITEDWFFAAVAVTLACGGVDAIVRSHPRLGRGDAPYTVTFWILPGFLLVGATFFLNQMPDLLSGLAGLAVTGLLLAAVIIAEYHTIDPDDRLSGLARLALNLTVYLVAFLVLTTIYSAKSRSLVSASTIVLVSTLLAVELLRGTEQGALRTWFYALICGLIIGEVTWALNYWAVGQLVGGVLLLLMFYMLTGVCQQYLARRLSRRVVLEFAFTSTVGLVLIGAMLRLGG
ncbi:MAG: hypothetical protein KKA73_08245 [Chloroflexi bacterium]|nr:hypothetical protein [Chloroflexota bacterium]MBU1747665.1 hypothetical protein [Chloroflexota bacterium]MBU1877613.1 hypothetical protein [Chloroflexota bacterium]